MAKAEYDLQVFEAREIEVTQLREWVGRIRNISGSLCGICSQVLLGELKDLAAEIDLAAGE